MRFANSKQQEYFLFTLDVIGFIVAGAVIVIFFTLIDVSRKPESDVIWRQISTATVSTTAYVLVDLIIYRKASRRTDILRAVGVAVLGSFILILCIEIRYGDSFRKLTESGDELAFYFFIFLTPNLASLLTFRFIGRVILYFFRPPLK